MSSLALIVKQGGFKVSGSDITKTHLTEKLGNAGIEVYIGQTKENIKNPDLVVYTAAIGSFAKSPATAVTYRIPQETTDASSFASGRKTAPTAQTAITP